MSLPTEIQKSNAWVGKCADLLTGLVVTGGQRMNIAVALLHLCNEHHQAIDLLISNGVNGSAFALFRPQFDAYVRAIWIQKCASEGEIVEYLDEKKSIPNLKAMIALVEGLPGFTNKEISAIYDRLYATLCSFTHGGAIQVKARIANGRIDENYLPHHIVDLLKTSALFSMMAAHAVSHFVGNAQVGHQIDAEFARIYPEAVSLGGAVS